MNTATARAQVSPHAPSFKRVPLLRPSPTCPMEEECASDAGSYCSDDEELLSDTGPDDDADVEMEAPPN
jgi:hypothetical protein